MGSKPTFDKFHENSYPDLEFSWNPIYNKSMTSHTKLISRLALKRITAAFQVNPIVALTGPRQCGKSTLAKEYAAEHFSPAKTHFFDLENPRDLARLANPMLALEDLTGLIVIDEIQRKPDLFPYLRTLVDLKQRKLHILILGSASRDLIKQSSETLAGRISYLELTPFTLQEVDNLKKLHLQGGFPLSYLSKNQSISYEWRNQYIATFLERDLYEFGFKISAQTMRRFWMMLTHYHGQLLNYSELSRAFGVSDMTVRHYLEILTHTYMIRLLHPWHENISKRQVKAPKLYMRDSGILHALLGIDSENALQTHPKIGASWEGFALEQLIATLNLRSEECFFWSTHGHAELDLLTFQKGKRIGYEIKYADAPQITKSMHIAIEDLALDHLYIITPKGMTYKLHSKITCTTLAQRSEI
jgi:predicted AAA+ superfamily ATPase